ncbi:MULTISPECIES: globin family protein [Rhodomicrobium]|uniref:globin family protein n=1 Tax=Rhodomicrobium TaxID=1068 RepID=UPI000B4B1C4A|nr:MULTISPECIES: globin family protein [Rhodomicrobium]
MNAHDVALIQSSFAQVKPISDQAAALFYGRLFEIAPEVKPLFQSDMTEQGRKLMGTLGYVVGGLSDLVTILPAASALAKKHVGYGVQPDHYGPVGEALLWTLEKGLGDQWTPDTATAWARAYSTLSGYMISEAYDAAAMAE